MFEEFSVANIAKCSECSHGFPKTFINVYVSQGVRFVERDKLNDDK